MQLSLVANASKIGSITAEMYGDTLVSRNIQESRVTVDASARVAVS